ncbi:14928_t:CDS:1 [Racocetra persica]|uniref:14928_t:CDS:1 n=1 Tax=Racocetra persica TaxID=160502 RepID=A0ACA9QXK3_9GLOM|nr:14928_t:CDS:1 [Racocetra persica]
MSNLTINPNDSLIDSSNGVINELDNSSDENKNSLDSLDNLINISKKALAILEQQKSVRNKKLGKAIKKNFNPFLKFVVDVKEYQRRRTILLTWKDHNSNTHYLL